MFESRIPNTLGILGFILTLVLVGAQELPDYLLYPGLVVGSLALILYWALSGRDRLPRWESRLAQRFLARTRDPHVQTLLTSQSNDALDAYLREHHSRWYTAGLSGAVRQEVTTSGGRLSPGSD
jgi:hypothetical protein